MKSILITGVSSGIGFGLTKHFINSGYHVFGSVRSLVKANEVKAVFGEHFTPLIFDLTDGNAIDDAFLFVEKEIGDEGYLAGLINNAGGSEIGPLLHLSLQDFRKQMEVLVVGQLYVIQKFSSLLLAPNDSNFENGRIVNISSVSGVSGNFGYGAYSAAKHALEGLSKTLRMELWNFYKIRVIVIGPGNVNTELWNKQVSGKVEEYKGTIYYNFLKSKINSVGSKGLLSSMIDINEFSNEFFKIFESANPYDRYTIKKVKILIGKKKTRVWRSTPLKDRIMDILDQINFF